MMIPATRLIIVKESDSIRLLNHPPTMATVPHHKADPQNTPKTTNNADTTLPSEPVTRKTPKMAINAMIVIGFVSVKRKTEKNPFNEEVVCGSPVFNGSVCEVNVFHPNKNRNTPPHN